MKKYTYLFVLLLGIATLALNTACQRDPNEFILKGNDANFVAFRDSIIKATESLNGANEQNNKLRIPVFRSALFDKDLVVEYQVQANYVKSNNPAGDKYSITSNAGEGKVLIPAGVATGEIVLDIINDTQFIDDNLRITITLTGTSQKEFTIGYPSTKQTPSTRNILVIDVIEDDCVLVVNNFVGTYANVVVNDVGFLWVAGVELDFVSNISLDTQPNTILDDNFFGIVDRAALGGLGSISTPTRIEFDPVTNTTNVPRQQLYTNSNNLPRFVETDDRPRGRVSTCTNGFTVNSYVRTHTNAVGTTFTATYTKQ